MIKMKFLVENGVAVEAFQRVVDPAPAANNHLQIVDLLIDLHHKPGAGFYEIAIAVALGAVILEHWMVRRGNEQAAKIVHGLANLSLGGLFVETIMRVLKMAGAMFFL